MDTTTEGRLYFIALRTLETLDIQYVPAKIDIQRGPQYADVQIVGRNNPLHHYTSGQTILKLDLDFHSAEEDRQDVIRKCRFIESLAYSDANRFPPQNIRLIWGQLFSNETWIVKGFSYKLTQFNKQKGMMPQQANGTVTLELDPDFNLTLEDVRSNG